MRMPEEQNRILTDHLSSYLFCPTDRAMKNLRSEGIPRPSVSGRPALVSNVGDIMLEASLFYRDLARQRVLEKRVFARLGLPDKFHLLTIHRAENTDDPERLKSIIGALNACSDVTIVFPVHPRTRKILTDMGISLAAHIRAIDPVGYLDMLELEEACTAVVTDSGGVQKEAYFFRKPCITIRDQTEWEETVEAGCNTLAGADQKKIIRELSEVRRPKEWPIIYGSGASGTAIARTLVKENRS